jgi:hypothetical protein
MKNQEHFLYIILCVAVIIFFTVSVAAGATTGTIDATNKYAWSNNAGWINFGCDSCSVQITSSAVTGYAWSDNYGWINLNPTNGGVQNDGVGNLSGYAWGQNAGWIDFGGVTINSSGQFAGTATGDIIGTVNFSCTVTGCPVTTDWRPVFSVGGYSNVSYPSSSGSSAVFSVKINNGATKTNNLVVTIFLDSSSEVAQVQISNSPNFSGVVSEAYKTSKSFVLSSGEGAKTVYVNFLDKQGFVLNTASASIILDTTPPLLTINQPKIFTVNESVYISGTSDPRADIIFSWDDKYGAVMANDNGKWDANLGVMSPGERIITAATKDDVGNISKTTTTVVVGSPQTPPEEQPPTKTPGVEGPVQSTIENVGGYIDSLIDFFLPSRFTPPEAVVIPKETPEVLKHKWNLLPINPPPPIK